jgi:hypothetical protein
VEDSSAFDEIKMKFNFSLVSRLIAVGRGVLFGWFVDQLGALPHNENGDDSPTRDSRLAAACLQESASEQSDGHMQGVSASGLRQSLQ